VSLVVPGLSLPALIKWLKVSETEEKEKIEERRLRLLITSSSLAFVNDTLAKNVSPKVLDEIKGRLESQQRYLKGVLAEDEPQSKADLDFQHEQFDSYLKSEEALIRHQRDLLIEMHKKGAFSAYVLKRIERDLDSRSLALDGRMRAFY
jgi:CPA1 family monovalent cation:H+ antiporter